MSSLAPSIVPKDRRGRLSGRPEGTESRKMGGSPGIAPSIPEADEIGGERFLLCGGKVPIIETGEIDVFSHE
jgi:hypothetical protein